MTYTLITGASSGIGRELAYLFAQDNHNLILVARDEQRLGEIKQHIETTYPVQVKAIALDLSTMDAAQRLYKHTNELGLTVDNLVNNAGFGRWTCFLDADIHRLNAMMALNMHTVAELMYYYGRDMRDRGNGKILNIASLAAVTPGPFMAMYYATKTFVRSLSQSVAYELKGSGVSVTTICPGPVNTNFGKNAAMHGKNFMTMTKPMNPQRLARFAFNKMMKGQTLAYPGALAKSGAFLSRFVPNTLSAHVAAFMNGGRPGVERPELCPQCGRMVQKVKEEFEQLLQTRVAH